MGFPETLCSQRLMRLSFLVDNYQIFQVIYMFMQIFSHFNFLNCYSTVIFLNSDLSYFQRSGLGLLVVLFVVLFCEWIYNVKFYFPCTIIYIDLSTACVCQSFWASYVKSPLWFWGSCGSLSMTFYWVLVSFYVFILYMCAYVWRPENNIRCESSDAVTQFWGLSLAWSSPSWGWPANEPQKSLCFPSTRCVLPGEWRLFTQWIISPAHSFI